MKKSLIVILSMLFVLGLTASAFAVHAEIPSETQSVVAKGATQITLGGEIRFRGELRNNLDFNDELGDNDSRYDGRVRLQIGAQVTPNTEGFVQLESGDSNTADVYYWGDLSSVGGATGNLGVSQGNSKKGDVRILQAWIQHKGSGLLGIPAGIKVGHMPIKLGRGLFLDHSKYGDDAILLFADPTKELHVALADAKFKENSATVNDDTNNRALLFDYKGNGFNLGGDITYLDVQDFVTGITSPTGDTTEGLNLWNFGLRGDTTVSVVTLYADLELQTGKARLDYRDRTTGARSDRKFKGYAWMLGASANLADVTVGLETAYGSGDKCDYANANANDSSAAGQNICDSGSKNESFVTSLGADQHYTYAYEYRAATSAGYDAFTTGTGLANTWYVKGSASMKPMPDLTAALSLYYLRAAKAVAINGALNSDGTRKTDKDIGVEIDGKITYQIDKNLVYFVEGGYLFAGKAYERDDPANSVNGNNLSPDDAYAVRHGITLSF